MDECGNLENNDLPKKVALIQKFQVLQKTLGKYLGEVLMVHKDASSRPIEKVLNEVLLLSYQCLQQPP